MTTRDAVIACFRVLQMDFASIALAYKLPLAEVEEIVRASVRDANRRRAKLTGRRDDLKAVIPRKALRNAERSGQG